MRKLLVKLFPDLAFLLGMWLCMSSAYAVSPLATRFVAGLLIVAMAVLLLLGRTKEQKETKGRKGS